MRYRDNRLVRIGLVLLVVGSGPLFLIMLCAHLGLLADPDPNPVGAGMLCGLTFWPAVILLGIGTLQVRRSQ
jgi:hypothetical protein